MIKFSKFRLVTESLDLKDVDIQRNREFEDAINSHLRNEKVAIAIHGNLQKELTSMPFPAHNIVIEPLSCDYLHSGNKTCFNRKN